MTTWDKSTKYFSGQGVVLIGERDAAGKPKGLVAVGNVSGLSVAIEETVIEHKESQSGQRSIDKRLPTETKCTLRMNVENFISANLAIALRASETVKAAGAVVNEALKMYIGKVMPFKNAKVSTVNLTNGAVVLTVYTNDQTPYDYKLNADSGSVEFNDGSSVLVDTMADNGTTITDVTEGSTTTIVVGAVPAYFEVGGRVAITGVAGADAAKLNEKTFKIVSLTATDIVIDIDTTGDTITSGTGKIEADGAALEVDYDFAAQNLIDSLSVGSSERYLRFEGLNTADELKPVIVDVFKFDTSPLAELALIGEEIQGFALEGNVLNDPLQTTGSKFFSVRMLS
jgi:hypothetical protein